MQLNSKTCSNGTRRVRYSVAAAKPEPVSRSLIPLTSSSALPLRSWAHVVRGLEEEASASDAETQKMEHFGSTLTVKVVMEKDHDDDACASTVAEDSEESAATDTEGDDASLAHGSKESIDAEIDVDDTTPLLIAADQEYCSFCESTASNAAWYYWNYQNLPYSPDYICFQVPSGLIVIQAGVEVPAPAERTKLDLAAKFFNPYGAFCKPPPGLETPLRADAPLFVPAAMC